LVDKIRNLTSNAPQNYQKFNDFKCKTCAAGQIYHDTKCTADKTYQTKFAAGQIF